MASNISNLYIESKITYMKEKIEAGLVCYFWKINILTSSRRKTPKIRCFHSIQLVK